MLGPRRLLHKFTDMAWEFYLGVNTRGLIPVENVPASYHSSTTSYRGIMEVLRSLSPGPDDVFVDVGCGKGRVVCCACRFPFGEVIGIDLDGKLCSIARKNVDRVRGRQTEARIVNELAQDYDYSAGNIFYLFDPFPDPVMSAFLERLKESVATKPRSIRIAYVQPAFDDLFENSGWLERYDRWEKWAVPGLSNPVSFWKSVQPQST